MANGRRSESNSFFTLKLVLWQFVSELLFATALCRHSHIICMYVCVFSVWLCLSYFHKMRTNCLNFNYKPELWTVAWQSMSLDNSNLSNSLLQIDQNNNSDSEFLFFLCFLFSHSLQTDLFVQKKEKEKETSLCAESYWIYITRSDDCWKKEKEFPSPFHVILVCYVFLFKIHLLKIIFDKMCLLSKRLS